MDFANYTAGFSRLDITPHLGVALGGSWDKRYGSGIHDPLYVNAVAFGDGQKSAVILVLDLLGLYPKECDSWPIEIADSLGLETDSVIVCCTHTHTSPSIGTDPDYDKWLLRRLKDAAKLALDDRKEVLNFEWAEENTEGLAFVRRFFTKDGTVVTNPIRDQIEAPACEGDDSMRVIRIKRQESDIVLVNFHTHPDTTGGDFYSADFPGAVRSKLESIFDNTNCVYINGAEGQMVIGDRRSPIPSQKSSHQRAVNYGEKLALAAAEMLTRTVSSPVTGLSYGHIDITLKTKRDSARVPEAQKIMDLYNEGKFEEIHPSRKIANYIFTEARQICRLEEENCDCRTAAISAISFCGLVLVGIPGEPFCEIGKQIRQNSKFPLTCVCCQANGAHGYLPTAEAYDQGGYEPHATPYIKGVAENIIDTANKLLESL